MAIITTYKVYYAQQQRSFVLDVAANYLFLCI